MGHKVTDRMAWRGIAVETRQKRGARTTGDDGFEVDDRVGEGGAVEGLAGYLECREEEWCGHRRKRTVALQYCMLSVALSTIARDLANLKHTGYVTWPGQSFFALRLRR